MYQKTKFPKTTLLLLMLSLLWLLPTPTMVEAQSSASCDYFIGRDVAQADGRSNYSDVKPGDVVCIEAGTRGGLTLKNFKGTETNPIIFKNNGGQVVINSTSYYGIRIMNNQHFQVTGTGSDTKYGIKIIDSQNQGVRIGWRSEYMTIDHIEIAGVPKIGIQIQTKATCSDGSSNEFDYDNDGQILFDLDDVDNRDRFVQRDTILRDLYIHNVGTEGFYIGSTYYTYGLTEICATGTEVIYAPALNNIQIFDNLVEDTGWDGIQVGSADNGCAIYGNEIYRDSRSQVDGQQSAIMNNPGSVCDIYNNLIKDSDERGIIVQGNGGNKVYNNIIVDAGQGRSDQGSGIYIGKSNGSGNVTVFNNTIIDPYVYGIAYGNAAGNNNAIENNIIVNPGKNEGINIFGDSKVAPENNFVAQDLAEVKFVNPAQSNFELAADSPMVDQGLEQPITTDFEGAPRPQGAGFDLGAVEAGDIEAPVAEEPTITTIADFALQTDVFQVEAYPEDEVIVALKIKNADNMYGAQVTCEYDPEVVTLADVFFGGFFADPLIGANINNTDSGVWTGALSQKNPAPALYGDGRFATLHFDAVAAGSTNIVCQPLASDRDGLPQTVRPIDGTVTVLDMSGLSGAIQGVLAYQGRFENDGIELSLSGPVETTAQTDEVGQFGITELPNGDYTIRADADLYLPMCTSAIAHDSQVTELMRTYLLGGDTDDDDAIKINDVTLVGSNLGLSATSTPAMDPRADLNRDGEVNVQDLSMVGGNYGLIGCQDWETDIGEAATAS